MKSLPHTLGTLSCFIDILFQAFQGSCPQVTNSGREKDPGKAQVCWAGRPSQIVSTIVSTRQEEAWPWLRDHPQEVGAKEFHI